MFISSLIFFAWGGVSYSLILIFSLIFNYFTGRAIAFTSKKILFLVVGISINLLVIGIFKYAGFITESINSILNIIDVNAVKVPKILLPVGISFYTFQAISYLIDIYRNKARVQKQFVNVALYISLFPQLIAGPIIRYHDIARQLIHRVHSYERFSSGVIRFILGLGKKVLIANTMAVIADQVFSYAPAELTLIMAWSGLIAYAIQIYFDFSGYSDMAIGLGRMFGFEILENFNFPYIAKSIREFWRRWHISLSNWFKDYLYISIGGNRAGKYRTFFNLFLVFFVTGLWHGASWNFVMWGMVHGLLMIFERLGFQRVLGLLPKMVQNIYVLLAVILTWVLFRADDFNHATGFYKALFSFNRNIITDIQFIFLLNKENLIVFGIAVLGSFGAFPYFMKQGYRISNYFKLKNTFIAYTKLVVQIIFIVVILLLSTTYLVNNTYNPFIYFRF